MKLMLLVLAIVALPAVWGWVSYWLMIRLWPVRPSQGQPSPVQSASQVPYDYQI